VNQYSYSKPNWFEYTAVECAAVRNNVAIFDQSSFGKHLVHGPDALTCLQRICAADIDVAVGKLVYTHMLNQHGGIEVDLTVHRVSDDSFHLVTSATSQPRDLAWIIRNRIAGENVSAVDMTSSVAVLSVQGPNSRALLQDVSSTDFSNEAFPFATARQIELGRNTLTAYRLTYVGELGYELYIPIEIAQQVCTLLLDTGARHQLQPAGYNAIEHLRMECGFREFPLDMTPRDTLLEAGLGFTAKFDTRINFNGRDALLRQKDAPLRRRLVQFKLHDPDAVLWHDEPIRMNGNVVGYIGSGAYSFMFGRSLGMGYVTCEEGITQALLDQATFEIELACERIPATASLRPFFDPQRVRPRGLGSNS
jgi:4-methylaminobutanoate oxidase (formaldehyde-forming)